MTNEDQSRALIKFTNGAVADVMWSTVATVGKPLWRILGTQGGLIDTGQGGNVGYEKQIRGPSGGALTKVTLRGGRPHEEQLPYLESDWPAYWQGVADHLLRGAPVPVSGLTGRRVIGVLEAAAQSSAAGQTITVPYP